MGVAAPKDVTTHVLIIAGGSGTRFWPKSRQGKPKQLLRIWDERTLLEHTAARFAGWKEAHMHVVTTDALVAPSKKVMGKLDAELPHGVNFIAEPAAKNTAPCILLGLLRVHHVGGDDPVICVIPADHYISDDQEFQISLKAAVKWASAHNVIVTLGIRPDRPETGYGYIEMGGPQGDGFNAVASFVEKPDMQQALKYLKSGRYLWNAGIFVFKASVGMKAFSICMPSLFNALTKNADIASAYNALTAEDAISIDYGIMESVQSKGISVNVFPVSYGWSDLGSYTALEEIDKSVVGNVVAHNSASNIVQCDSGLVALLGVNDFVVVKEGDIVLVAAKDRCEDIRKLVERVKKDFPQFS